MAHESAASAKTVSVVASDWRTRLPVLAGSRVTLRELRASDAPSLLAMLSTEEVSRFITPPPTTVEEFERFIAWTHAARAAGRYICFGVVPHGLEGAIGLFQVWPLEPSFANAEWGFAIGSPFWGTGVFVDSARLVLDFAFETLQVHRLEGRCADENGRGNGALRKLGAVPEGILRKFLVCPGKYLDHILWSILREDWRQANAGIQTTVH